MQAVGHNGSLYATVPDSPSPGVWYRDYLKICVTVYYVYKCTLSSHQHLVTATKINRQINIGNHVSSKRVFFLDEVSLEVAMVGRQLQHCTQLTCYTMFIQRCFTEFCIYAQERCFTDFCSRAHKYSGGRDLLMHSWFCYT